MPEFAALFVNVLVNMPLHYFFVQARVRCAYNVLAKPYLLVLRMPEFAALYNVLANTPHHHAFAHAICRETFAC